MTGDGLQLMLLLGARRLCLFEHPAVVSFPVGWPTARACARSFCISSRPSSRSAGGSPTARASWRRSFTPLSAWVRSSCISSLSSTRASRCVASASRWASWTMFSACCSAEWILASPTYFRAKKPADHTDDRHDQDYYDPSRLSSSDITIPVHTRSRGSPCSSARRPPRRHAKKPNYVRPMNSIP